MIIENDIKLSTMTTFRVGGVARNVFFPENEDELIEVLMLIGKDNYWIIGGGSNILINDKRVFDNVICTKKLDLSIEQINDLGLFYVGAACRIQDVIEFVNQLGFGGFEEFVSIPATFGGMVYMNAGIGSKQKQIINLSDFIVRVKALRLNDREVVWLSNVNCQFDYRHSIFHDDQYVILGAEIQVNKQELEVSKTRIEKRRQRCKETQEYGKGCLGSCCKEYSRRIQKVVRALPIHKRVSQSNKNANWLINRGNASFDDAIRIIYASQILHKIFKKKFDLEIIIWY